MGLPAPAAAAASARSAMRWSGLKGWEIPNPKPQTPKPKAQRSTPNVSSRAAFPGQDVDDDAVVFVEVGLRHALNVRGGDVGEDFKFAVGGPDVVVDDGGVRKGHGLFLDGV